MITLTRLSGSAFALNPDLIQRIDSTPDTILTLIDGSKYVVTEGLHEVATSIRDYRADILATAMRVADAPVEAPSGRLLSIATVRNLKVGE